MHCTACGACIQVCPKQCIAMKENDDGYCYPAINSSMCIECGRCETVCPINFIQEKPSTKVYAAVNLDKNVLDAASSGGIFGAIAEWVLNREGVVYGCAYTERMKAAHIRIDSFASLHTLFGSKYIQSDTNISFISAKKDLAEGRWVAYSGTPCQIAGLRCFLGKEYERLITVDIICHGVPSQAYFNKYISWLEEHENAGIQEYQFRNKSNHGWSLAGDYTTVNKKNILKRHKLFYFNHYYYFYFLEGSIYRECCYNCKYANLNRVGDFTLGDLWGVERLNLNLDTRKGCSVVLANTNKAQSIINEINIYKTEIEVETAVRYNEQLEHPSKVHPDRQKRLEDFRKYSGATIQKLFLEQNKAERLKGRIKYLVPVGLTRYINKIRFRIGK